MTRVYTTEEIFPPLNVESNVMIVVFSVLICWPRLLLAAAF